MSKKEIINLKNIDNKIYTIRNKKVMLDRDLAELYGVKTGILNRQVKRNIERFPVSFMFQLSSKELEDLRCQFGTANISPKSRVMPYVFTEHGILMLSSVLNSKRAISVNIQIMETFTRMREALLDYADLNRKIEYMERRYDSQFKIVFDALKKLLSPGIGSKTKKIGFKRK